jgi:hypothetical protein
MIAMSSLRKRVIKEQLNLEICHLRKGFKALTIDHQKGVLKTARGLLRIQRAYRTMVTDNTWYVDFSVEGKKSNNDGKFYY